MYTYDILRWDSVIPEGETFPYPMVYIKPDNNFFDYIEKNSIFEATIDGTSLYDKKTVGIGKESGYFPNFRPFFFNDTKTAVIILLNRWNGYPFKNGTVKIGEPSQEQIENAIKIQDNFVPKPIEWYKAGDTNTNTENKTIGQNIVIISVCLVMLALLIFIVTNK